MEDLVLDVINQIEKDIENKEKLQKTKVKKSTTKKKVKKGKK